MMNEGFVLRVASCDKKENLNFGFVAKLRIFDVGFVSAFRAVRGAPTLK